MGVPQGQGVSDPRIDELIRKAQGAVEAKYYEIRKDTTKYGQVGNKQRETFTGFRDQIEENKADMDEMSRGWIPRALAYEAFSLEAERQKASKPEIELEWIGIPNSLNGDQLKTSLDVMSKKYGFPLTAEMPDGWFRKKKKVTLDELEESLAPQLIARYDEAAKEFPPDALARFQRKAMLDVADDAWMSHLDNMEGLRNGIGMEAMAQKDPWIEYQLRAYSMFKEMMEGIEHEAGSGIFLQMLNEAEMIKKTRAAQPATTPPTP
jgi:preprotein translocase subunit SecA